MNYLQRLWFNFRIGLSALLTNRVRALLTSLGIIFGVASVIAMLAIGRGAEKEILQQIKQVGSNNIVIKAVIPGSVKQEPGADQTDESGEEKSVEKNMAPKRNVSPGLRLADLENLLQIPSIDYISAESEMDVNILYQGISGKGKLTGVTNHFFESTNTKLAKGKLFTEQHLAEAIPVCIIGWNIEKKYFPGINPIGQSIKCGREWLKIVGVMEQGETIGKESARFSIRDVNEQIFTPLPTMLMRIQDRSRLTPHKMQVHRNSGARGNYHQLDKMVVHVAETGMVQPTVELMTRMLNRRHGGSKDVEIIVPELLLKQEQKTKQLFNIVLAIIASISLIVGGIGIMNIMLASVLERTREIGLRLAIGATKKDVVLQFLSEAISLCVTGGLIGVLLGVGISFAIQKATDIETSVSLFSILLSFSISALTGLLFGWFPARKAAANNPVVSLKSE